MADSSKDIQLRELKDMINDLKKMIKTLLRIIKPAGFLAAYKGKTEAINTEMEAIADIIPYYTVQPLTVPFLEERQRHLVVIQKYNQM